MSAVTSHYPTNTLSSILAIDTVFDQCSVAIWHQQSIAHVQTIVGKREQTQVVLPMVDAAMSQTGLQTNQLSAIAFNRGPGAFSGIRIDTAVAQALSFAYDVPCVGVSSLQILAQAAYEQYGYEQVFACLDARMQQVYVGEFAVQDGLMQPVKTAQPSEYLLDYDTQTHTDYPIVGNGAGLLTAYAKQIEQTQLQLDAGILVKLAAAQYTQDGGVPAEQALPVYLRNNAWKTLKEQGKTE